jgi:multiple sugar transport system substrate-binding protein
MIRTATPLAVVAVMSLVLTSCGRDEAGGGGEAQSTAISDGAATGTIEVWAMGTEGDELQAFSADFVKANPDAEVNVTAIPWDAAHNKIANAIASGETPDVSLIGTTWMGEFAEAGGLMPTPEGLVDEADFFPGAWGSTEVGGTSYGVPWYVETRVLYYRKDMAEKAGWSEAPQTWEELHQFATDMKEKGGADYGLSLQPGQTGSWQSVLPFAWSNGAAVTDEAGTEYTIDSPEMVEALDYYTSYFDEDLSPSRLLDPGELESGFADGTYAAFISGPWHTGLVEEAGLSTDEYAVAPLPGKDSGPGTSFVGGGDLAVFVGSPAH